MSLSHRHTSFVIPTQLLFDLGNTRLKWALADASGLHPGTPLGHAGQSLASQLPAAWRGLPAPEQVWVASVAGPAREAELAAAVRSCFGRQLRFVGSVAEACGVHNAYPQAQRLGVDRFLALIALHAAPHGPLLLASCGTALTLDVLAADGRHCGGLIAPSPALMQDALYRHTAQLRPGSAPPLVALADNTDAAIHSGTWLAAAALVERTLAHTQADFGAPVTLILSGGGAGELQAALGGQGRIDADLVLHGLARYAATLEDSR